MNLNQLKYFATIAQLNNLSKASEILGINQPSLSKSINSLEEELGYKLFDRNGKKIVLNKQGERFLECVDRIYEDLTRATMDMQKLAGTDRTNIRIGSVGCIKQICECAANFKKDHPECEFIFDFNLDNAEKIDIKNYDVVFYPDEVKYSYLDGESITQEKYCLAVSVNHPLSSSPICSPKLLENQDIIFVNFNNHPEYSFHICKSLDIKFRSVNYTTSRQSQLQLISSGFAVGLVPDSLIDSIDPDKIKLIPFLNKNFSRNIMICFRRDKYLSPAALEFKDSIPNFF